MSDDVSAEREVIAGRLRLAREHAGLSQGQVAVKLGLHRPAVCEIEAGRRKVPAEELAQLCALYDVDADWVVCGESPTVPTIALLAAREIAKLKPGDREVVMTLLRSLRQTARAS